MGVLNDLYHKNLGKAYYFTFSSCSYFPFQDGWVKVFAHDRNEAVHKFNAKYGTSPQGFINCSFIYSEEEFKATKMYKGGNLGGHCKDVII